MDKTKFVERPGDSEGFTDLENTPMPWCDHCACYHHHTARCITRHDASPWSQISDADLDAVHTYWRRQA